MLNNDEALVILDVHNLRKQKIQNKPQLMLTFNNAKGLRKTVAQQHSAQNIC